MPSQKGNHFQLIEGVRMINRPAGMNTCVVEVESFTLYFSYDVLIAFDHPKTGLIISVNHWTVTTGKHITQLCGSKDRFPRVGEDEFRAKWEEAKKADRIEGNNAAKAAMSSGLGLSYNNLDSEFNQLVKAALHEVEIRARELMLACPEVLKEFVMCMGTWHFNAADGEIINSFDDEKHVYAQPRRAKELFEKLDKIFDEWDSYLKLTGYPMRFTAKGEVITDW